MKLPCLQLLNPLPQVLELLLLPLNQGVLLLDLLIPEHWGLMSKLCLLMKQHWVLKMRIRVDKNLFQFIEF